MSTLDEIYALAEPYWQTRSNEIHVPGAYRSPSACWRSTRRPTQTIVLPAVLLHDCGYFLVPEEDHLKGLAEAPGRVGARHHAPP